MSTSTPKQRKKTRAGTTPGITQEVKCGRDWFMITIVPAHRSANRFCFRFGWCVWLRLTWTFTWTRMLIDLIMYLSGEAGRRFMWHSMSLPWSRAPRWDIFSTHKIIDTRWLSVANRCPRCLLLATVWMTPRKPMNLPEEVLWHLAASSLSSWSSFCQKYFSHYASLPFTPLYRMTRR